MKNHKSYIFSSRMALCAAVPFLLSGSVNPSLAEKPKAVSHGLRVFSAGHSFHFLNYSLPDLLREIALSAGYSDHQVVGTSIIFGSKVVQHWDIPDADNKAKAALVAGDVDVLTVTPIYLPDNGIEDFAKLGFQHNPNFRETVQEFWLPFDKYQPHYYDAPLVPSPKIVDHNAATVAGLQAEHKRYFQEMDKLVEAINKNLGKQVVFVVPVGQAVIALRAKIIAGEAPGVTSQDDLFVDALGHPAPPLQALIAYCHFAVIYRRSPMGLPPPSVLTKSNIPAGDILALNLLLQQLAWDAAIHNHLSGVK